MHEHTTRRWATSTIRTTTALMIRLANHTPPADATLAFGSLLRFAPMLSEQIGAV